MVKAKTRPLLFLIQAWTGEDADAASRDLGLCEPGFPILVPIEALSRHIDNKSKSAESAAANPDAALWLPHYLAASAGQNNLGLDLGWFLQRLETGPCLVMLDGLDEVGNRLARQNLSRLIANLVLAYPNCRLVVTTRPGAYKGEVVIPGFAEARIDHLPDQAIETFLTRWSAALWRDVPSRAQTYRDELLAALHSRPEIRRLARNPVMLTALAVVHWNEKSLPEQRAELYASIIGWLSRSREARPGRLPAAQCVTALQELALAIHIHPEGRQIQVPRRWAAEAIAGELAVLEDRAGARESRHDTDRAERFLAEENRDSGIVVGRGNELRFWHLTFQEYLAARAIAGRSEKDQKQLLWAPPDRIYRTEWRETMLLLAGVLHEHGRAKIDGLVRDILDHMGDGAALADQARCVGLLGAMLRDLAPFRYRPAGERYRQILDAVMALFEVETAATIPFEHRLAAADALGQAGDPRLADDNPERWVEIPAAKVWLGAQSGDPKQPCHDEQAQEQEQPVRRIHLDALRIGRYPVTEGNTACLSSAAATTTNAGGRKADSADSKRPMSGRISWSFPAVR